MRKSAIFRNRRELSTFFIIIQSCGIRFFDGQGTFLLVLVILLSFNSFKLLKKRDWGFLLGALVILLLNWIINDNFMFSKMVFQFALILEAYVFLLSYKKTGIGLLREDLMKVLHVLFWHALIGFGLYFIIPSAFVSETRFLYPYNTFLHIFYVTIPLGGTARNTGLLWEPGLLQLMMNLYLFFCIRSRKKTWLLLGIVLVILSTFSTAGFITLGINYVYYLVFNYKRNFSRVRWLIVITVCVFSSLAFILNNISDKLSAGNTSGLARIRDFQVGVELIREAPILGHGLFDAKYLAQKSYSNLINENLFDRQYLQVNEYENSGYTNGILGFIASYGLIIGIIVMWLFYKNRIIGSLKRYERIIFFILYFVTLNSEPISYTVFFLIFPFSAYIFKNESENINRHSRLQRSKNLPGLHR